jgi:hypothetical protein
MIVKDKDNSKIQKKKNKMIFEDDENVLKWF